MPVSFLVFISVLGSAFSAGTGALMLIDDAVVALDRRMPDPRFDRTIRPSPPPAAV